MQALYRLQVLMELADRFSGPSAKIAQNLQRLQVLTERVSLAQERLGTGLSTLAAGTALAAPLVLAPLGLREAPPRSPAGTPWAWPPRGSWRTPGRASPWG